MKILSIILVSILLVSCTSLSEPIVVKNELHIPRIILPNAPVVIPLQNYEIIPIKLNKQGLMCLDGVNFKIVGNNDNKKDSYILKLENQLNYLREVVRKQNKESKK